MNSFDVFSWLLNCCHVDMKWKNEGCFVMFAGDVFSDIILFHALYNVFYQHEITSFDENGKPFSELKIQSFISLKE